MGRWWVTVGSSALVGSMGCADSNGGCIDRYFSTVDGDIYETTCDTPVGRQPGDIARPSADSPAELAAGECLETYATSCPVGQPCQELYERRCENGSANIPLTEMGQLASAILIADCTIKDNSHTVTALRPIPPPFAEAVDAINADFADDEDVDIVFGLHGVQSRGAQGELDVRTLVIGSFSDRGPDIMGTTSCIRDGGTGDRGKCSITVYQDAIELVSEETGNDFFEVMQVTAMHEFGHTFCLDHITIDSSAAITAMNSFHNRDTSRPQLDYMKFLGSERDQVRSIIREPE